MQEFLKTGELFFIQATQEMKGWTEKQVKKVENFITQFIDQEKNYSTVQEQY